jgi:RecA-family ATPase
MKPIVPVGRQVAIFSPAKQGKSLFALDACAAAATGGSILGQPPAEPIHIVYIDQEMGRDDLRERLKDMGYGPASDLSRLYYYQLVNLPPLELSTAGRSWRR